MNAATILTRYGVDPKVKGDDLVLYGLEKLPTQTAFKVIKAVKAEKAQLISFLCGHNKKQDQGQETPGLPQPESERPNKNHQQGITPYANALTQSTYTNQFHCSCCGGHLYWINLIGNRVCAVCHKPAYQTRIYGQGKRRKKFITPSMLKAFKTARPFLLSRLNELEAKGWTRRKLFRIGKYKYPLGDWGLAWSGIWQKDGLKVEIKPDGEILFTWTDRTGRETTQSARP